MSDSVFISHADVVTSVGFGLEVNTNQILANKSFYRLNSFQHYHPNFPTFLSGVIPLELLSASDEVFKPEKVLDLLFRSIASKSNVRELRFDKLLILFRGAEVFDLYLSRPHTSKLIQSKTDLEIISKLIKKNKLNISSKDVLVIDNTCTTGISLITTASQFIKAKQAENVLVCAIDLINPFMLYFLNSLGALVNTDIPEKQFSMPFDINRNGFVKSESGSIAIISNNKFNTKHDQILELLGYSQTNDAYRITDGRDDGQFIKLAMSEAIKNSQLTANDLSFIKAHGTSTVLNDRHEANAIFELFGDCTKTTSLKGHLGHTTDASGLIETILIGELLKQNIIPCTLNTRNNEFDIDLIMNEHLHEKNINYFMANAFGFGGNNISAVFKTIND